MGEIRSRNFPASWPLSARGMHVCGAALAGAGTACSGPQSALDPAGPAAAAIAHTGWLMFAGAAAVWLLVLSMLAAALWRRRGDGRGDGRIDAQRSPEWMIVAGGVALPTVTLAALLVYGTATSQRVTGSADAVDEVIDVIARQWSWEFRYRGDAGDDAVADAAHAPRTFDRLLLPHGRMVEFRVSSGDVIHSFWIPRLGGKVDAIPGRINTLRLRVDGQGAIRGQCAEFCGREHALMRFEVEVLAPDAFDTWRRNAGEGAARAESAAP